MNFTFDASKTQQPSMNQQTPAAGTQGFTAGATGAGDAGKMLSTGFNVPSIQAHLKLIPFGSTSGGTPAPTFGSPAAPAAGGQNVGLNLGAATSNPGLTFGATSTPATGLNFSMGGSTAAPTSFGTSGFTAGGLGATNAASTPGGLSFAAPKPAATPASTGTGFSLGAGAATPAATNASKMTFGTIVSATPANTGFSLGGASATPAATAATTTGTSFGLATSAATNTQQPGLGLGATTSTSGFSLAPNSGAQSLATGFGVGQTTGATSAGSANAAAATATIAAPSTGFSLQGTAATPLASGFNLGSNAAPTLSSGFALNKTTTTQTVSSAVNAAVATTNAPQTTLGTVTTVSSAGTGQSGTMNFCQLEESINKWTLELEEQEKAFVNQATQVNNWDKLLIANGEKIATLNQEVERVKLEQQQLEHELDYVVGQQKELQDCLVPLEKELASLSVADPERDYTYRLAENLDKQLKTMSQDLKEIIEHLNEANRSQDSSDPIVQIGKILNAHMNSLQWLDQRTSVLGQKIQQIDQMHQNFRQENERSFSLAYN